ncbi:MAG: acetyltransferase [Oscillospiraceae bacterium]|nr:acetyltransferase [Oscillospiraceae bacterium]
MKRKELVLIGAGGLGREVLWQLDALDRYDILGFVDDAPSLQGASVNGLPVVGDTQWLIDYPKEICAVICVGNSQVRKNIYNKIKVNPRVSFPTVIADNVRFSPFVTFGQGCVICLSTVLTVNIALGDFVVAGVGCTVGHDAALDDFVTLYPGAVVSGNVHIGACAEIGTGANIIQGKRVGGNAVIGAGAVVVRDIPADCTAVGVPAKPIKFH